MSNINDTFSMSSTVAIIDGKAESDWDYPHADNDNDLSGENGLDYVSEKAQKLGYDNNMDYYLSLRPHKKPETEKQLEENWEYICKQVYDNDGFYSTQEVNFYTKEIPKLNAVMLTASFYGETSW